MRTERSAGVIGFGVGTYVDFGVGVYVGVCDGAGVGFGVGVSITGAGVGVVITGVGISVTGGFCTGVPTAMRTMVLPLASGPVVPAALGMKSTEMFVCTDVVPVSVGSIAAEPVALPSVYAAPQGIALPSTEIFNPRAHW